MGMMKSFMFVKYPESSNIETIIESLKKKIPDLQYCYILHNKDKNEKGELKKEHWHFLGWSYKGIDKQSLSNTVGVKVEGIEPIRDKFKSIQYLIHLNNEDKFKYEPEDIKSGGIEPSLYLFSDESTKRSKGEKKDEDMCDALSEIYDFLDNHKSYKYLCRYIVSRPGLLNAFRLYHSSIVKYYEELTGRY